MKPIITNCADIAINVLLSSGFILLVFWGAYLICFSDESNKISPTPGNNTFYLSDDLKIFGITILGYERDFVPVKLAASNNTER